jgi:hypothetical protein
LRDEIISKVEGRLTSEVGRTAKVALVWSWVESNARTQAAAEFDAPIEAILAAPKANDIDEGCSIAPHNAPRVLEAHR